MGWSKIQSRFVIGQAGMTLGGLPGLAVFLHNLIPGPHTNIITMYPKQLESVHLRKTKSIGKHKIEINLGSLAGRWGALRRWLLWVSILPIVVLVGVFVNKQYSFWDYEVGATPDRNLAVRQEGGLPHSPKGSALSDNQVNPVTALVPANSLPPPVTDKVSAANHVDSHQTVVEKPSGPTIQTSQSEKTPVINKGLPAPPTTIKDGAKTVEEKPISVVKPLSQASSSLPAKLLTVKPDLPTLPASKSSPSTSSQSRQEKLAPLAVKKATPSPEKSVSPPVKKTTLAKKGTEVAEWLQECKDLLKANQLIAGKGNTAVDCYKKVLEQDSHNTEAQAGLKQIEERYREWAEGALNQGQWSKARSYLQRLRQVNPRSAALSDLQQRLTAKQTRVVSPPPPSTSPPLPKTSSPASSKPSSPPSKTSASRPVTPPSKGEASRSKEESAAPASSKPSSPPSKGEASRPAVTPPSKGEASRSKEESAARSETVPRSSVQSPRPRTPPAPHSDPSVLPHTPPRSAESSASPPRESLPPPPIRPQPPRCSEIFIQESLGIQSLTQEQREFKRKFCN